MNYDAELETHKGPLLRACAIRSHEHVLDVGCGSGETTREAACLASAGSALGIDIMEGMVARARGLAESENLRNVRFELGDAQVHAFAPKQFDLAMSRYGTMFFSDPIAAFRNIRTALRPGGRLVMMVWQAHELNEWSIAVHQALAPYFASEPGGQEHFSFADPGRVGQILGAAGFASVTFTDVREPVYYGADVDEAMEWIGGFRFVREILQALDADAVTRVLESLRETLAKHSREKGVWFDAREWIVSAQSRSAIQPPSTLASLA